MASTAPAPSASQDSTYQQYLELDDERHYEIIDGELLIMPRLPGGGQVAISVLLPSI